MLEMTPVATIVQAVLSYYKERFPFGGIGMEFLKSFYANYFTVGALIPACFHLFLAFLFLHIEKKSRSTFHIGMGLVAMTVFNLAYTVAGSFYHPLAAFHRWVTVGVILIAETHFTMFAFYLCEEKRVTFGKWFLVAQYAVALVVVAVFFAKTYGAGIVYHFAGNYYDFDAEGISRVVAICIILYILIFFGVILWKVFTISGRDRWIVLAIGITYLLATVVPSVTNMLSRDGVLDRGTFQITWDLFNILGFFMMAILYINYTNDRTTFMAKIVGISLATLLLVLQGLSYVTFTDKEEAFDEIHRKSAELVLRDDRHPHDLAYVTAFSPGSDGFTRRYIASDAARDIDFHTRTVEFLNAAIVEKIAALPADSFEKELPAVLAAGHNRFDGYRAALERIAASIPRATPDPARLMVARVEDLAKALRYRANKIRNLPSDDFRASLAVYLNKTDDAFRPFATAMRDHLKRSRAEGFALKGEVLDYIAPMQPAGVRIYRGGRGAHFVSYMRGDGAGRIIHEVGFTYESYRAYLHPAALKMVIMLVATLMVVMVGFRFFFLGALINPLETLLHGLQEVRQGNLDIRIPIKVEDEIGFLTYNFNRMVRTIRSAKKRLDNHAENLEKIVDRRTAELKVARDALWGEMELAKRIQTILLPEHPSIPGYEIAAHMMPASEVGGDYYDVINDDEVDWVIIGDVSGHGVPAGLVMMMVQTSIQVILRGKPLVKPSVLLRVINRAITYNIKKLDEDKYMTITAFAFLKGGKVLFSGLHQDIYVFRAATGTVDVIETNGMWLGFMEDLGRLNRDFEFTLHVGDTLLLYTDGITEAMSPHGELFSNERLKQVFESLGGRDPEGIKRGILDAANEYTMKDDVTLFVMKRRA